MKIGTWITLKMLCGHCAMWSVRLSPYAIPDNLENALVLLHTKAKTLFDDNGMGYFTQRELAEFIDRHFISLLQVRAWNNRKNGREGYGIVSAYDGPRNPDDDFIDLDALRQNISATIWKECCET